MKDFRKDVEALREELIARRRDFHQHPELAFEEYRTAGIVAEALNDLGLEVQTGVGKTGVVAVLEGEQDGPTVLLRCDMDALPIIEQNQVDYCSQTQGKMHACGHDGHTAIGLTVAKILNQYRGEMKGRIKFIFQPAEEVAGGAAAMIKDGALEGPRPDVSFGLHLWNTLPVGDVAVTPGPSMAGSGRFAITLTGKGGHAAAPHETIDPVLTAAHITTALQSIISRNLSPLDTGVISVTQIHTGDAHNVIPSEAIMKGTIRFYHLATRELMDKRFRGIVNGIAEAMGCTASIDISYLTPPVINDLKLSEELTAGFQEIAPDLRYLDNERTMGGEDMAYFLQEVPGVYFFVGSANAERELNYAHHHPRFDFDEEALVIGASLLASAASEYVLPE